MPSNEQIAMRRIDKEIATRLQIETAIELFFDEKDSIPILSLAYSAWGIIKSLPMKGGHSVRTIFADEQGKRNGVHQAKAWTQLDSIWNYLKHAKRDKDCLFEYPDDIDELILFTVASDYKQVFPQSEIVDYYYLWWLARNKPEFLTLLSTEDMIKARNVYEKSNRGKSRNPKKKALLEIQRIQKPHNKPATK